MTKWLKKLVFNSDREKSRRMSIRWEKVTQLVLLLIPIFLVFLKGFAASITHDEAITYSRYVSHNMLNIITNNMPGILPNNHMLNTLLIKWFTAIFPFSEGILRLPNMLSFLLYVHSFYLLTKRFSSPIPKLSLIICGGYLLYITEFFSLARGYGLGLSLMMASLNQAICFIENGKSKNLYLSLLFGCLSVLANLIFMYFLIPSILMLVLTSYFSGHLLKRHLFIVLAFAIGLVCIITPSIMVLQNNSTLFGPTDDMWNTTYLSLILTTLYDISGELRWLAKLVQPLLMIITTILIIGSTIYMWRNWSKEHLSTIYVTGILILTVCMQLFGNVFLGHYLLSLRTGIFMIPLFILMIHFLINCLNRFRIIQPFPLLLLALPILVIYAAKWNSRSFFEWEYDQNTKQAFSDVKLLSSKHNERIRLGISWLYEPSLNLYIDQDPLCKIHNVDREGVESRNFEFDYYYLTSEDYKAFDKSRAELIQTYPFTESVLLKAR